jgi:sugar phosphate isomerase/epimerase
LAGAAPTFGISQITTLPASFGDDVRAYSAAGAAALGVWEIKLGEGSDDDALEALDGSGLRSGTAVPAIPSILPIPLGGPQEPAARVEAICRSLERLAAFHPSAVVCLTGGAGGRAADEARAAVVDGLRTIAAEAERLDLRIALEPYQREDGGDWSIVHTIRDAMSLIDDAGDPPHVGILFDVWHLWNDDGVYDDLARYGDRIAGVHVADYREPTRGFADRVLPGDGVADVSRLLRAVDATGWSGPYELEIFSDNGTFGSAYEDSLWDVPANELARRGRESFERAWTASA